MKTILPLRDAHKDVQRLLPWFVTGTLDPEDRQRVEAHLASCAECAAELAEEQHLTAAIAASSSASRPPASSGRAPFRTAQRRRWARYATIAAAQAAALLITIGVTRTVTMQEHDYRTLGSAAVAHPGNIVVMFGPETRQAQIARAVSSADARIVDGPTDTGAYVLHVADARRGTVLKILRAAPGVMLAEPIGRPPP